jgi:capsular exopolysaccharide synthesis family protein
MGPIERYRITPGADIPKWSEQFSLPPSVSHERVFTWEQAVRVLRKRGRFIVILAGVLTIAVVVAALSMKNVFQPTARIEIDPLESGIKTLQEIESANGPADLDYLQTQAQILQSDALAIRVIRVLHLDTRPGFVAGSLPGPDRQLQRTATAANKPDGNSRLLNEQVDLADRTPRESIALANLQQNLSVNPVRNSRLIEVSYAGDDPVLAQLITNTIVTQFIEQNYRNRYTSTMEASEWLSAQLNDLRQKVRKSSQAVADFQKRYGFVEADAHDVPLSQLMAEVNHQLSTAQADRIEAEAYARMVDLGQADALPSLREDQVYQNLMTRYGDVRAQLAEARAVYGDENSNVKKLEGESNELAAQVESERGRVSDRARASFGAARTREQMMLQSRETLRAAMGSESFHLMEYQLLKNEATANAELYNTLQGRLKEAGIYAGLRSSNIHVIDMAPKLMSPTGPHRRFFVVIGSFAAVLFALVLAFGWESFENTIRTPDDIKECVGLVSLAMLPTVIRNGIVRREISGSRFDNNNLAVGSAPHPWWATIHQMSESEGMRGLRTSLSVLLAQSGVPPRVVLVSSSLQGEGKTTVAVNLATAFAQRGRTCLLIDGDLRRPRIAEAFALNSAPGLTGFLNGTANAESAIVSTPQVPGLSILPSGSQERDPAGLLSVERMQTLLGSVRDKFNVIVIDSPPVIPFSDARLLALVSEAVILVSRYGYTTRRAITRGTQLLGEVRAPIAGVVLNGIDLASADYHYYNYGFSRGLIQSLDYSYSEPVSHPKSRSTATARDQGEAADGSLNNSDKEGKSKGAHA